MHRNEIIKLLFATPYEELQRRAAAVLAEEKGSHVFVRGLIEFSSVCRRSCLYCGLRSGNIKAKRYTLSKSEILSAAKEAVDGGVDTIVLQSGEYDISPQWLADIIHDITRNMGVPVTLSVGEQSEKACALWKEAGAKRFLLKHETADRELYSRLHPGHSLQERINCLKMLAKLGYETGSGFMIGLPGQNLETLADDILLAKELRVAMCGVGPFIPQKDTPLSKSSGGTADLTLRVMAVLRLVLPWVNMPSTTALATIDAMHGQKNGLLAGANVLMPVFTPAMYRKEYRIYDHKNQVNLSCACRAIEAAERTHNLTVQSEHALTAGSVDNSTCFLSSVWAQPAGQSHSFIYR